MKTRIASIVGFLLVSFAVLAWAAPEKFQTDQLIFGRKTSIATKSIEVEQNAGANNPKIYSDSTDLDFWLWAKIVKIGRGLAENVRLIVDKGGSNPELRWNNATSKWEFSNDGSAFSAFGSGGGGGGGGVLLNANGGFEEGTGEWTASGGTFADTGTAANVGFETKAGSWDASAASQTLSNTAVTVPAGLYGKLCSLSWYYKGGDANLKAQVYDGSNVLAESSAFTAQTEYSTKQALYFTCPSSGTIQARFISSADAAVIYLDDVRLGQEALFQSSPAKHIATLNYAKTSTCDWTKSSPSTVNFDAFPVDNDCPTATGGDLVGPYTANPLTKVPGIRLVNAPAGHYMFEVTGGFNSDSGSCIWALYDGATDSITHNETHASGGGTAGKLFFYSEQATSFTKTFELRVKSDSGINTCRAKANNGNITFTVYYYPSSGQEAAISVDKAGWRIDANIGGANPSLGTGAVSSYTEITDAALDLVLASGSASAEIPCSSTNPSTGLTCSAGNESLGVAFIPPAAGVYEVCAGFTHNANGNTGANVNSAFQLVETPNNAQTILQQGGERTTSGFDAGGGSGGHGMRTGRHVCGTFTFADVSKRTIRLMYEQTAGALVFNRVDADRSASTGQQDIKITVRRRVEFQDAIKFTNLATTGRQEGVKIETAYITNNGSVAAATNATSAWITATRLGTGSVRMDFTGWSDRPNCVLTQHGPAGTDGACHIRTDAAGGFSNTSQTSHCASSAGGSVDLPYSVMCVGW